MCSPPGNDRKFTNRFLVTRCYTNRLDVVRELNRLLQVKKCDIVVSLVPAIRLVVNVLRVDEELGQLARDVTGRLVRRAKVNRKVVRWYSTKRLFRLCSLNSLLHLRGAVIVPRTVGSRKNVVRRYHTPCAKFTYSSINVHQPRLVSLLDKLSTDDLRFTGHLLSYL